MKGVILLVVFLSLGGCAAISEWENKKLNPSIDTVVDEVYGRLCNLRFYTEQRFTARNQISPMTMMVFCRRMVPASGT